MKENELIDELRKLLNKYYKANQEKTYKNIIYNKEYNNNIILNKTIKNITDDYYNPLTEEKKVSPSPTYNAELSNPESIKRLIEKDINLINSIPKSLITNDLLPYVINLAKNNNYTLSEHSPMFLRKNFEIIKQTLKLDKESATWIIWDGLSMDEINSIERYIVENSIDYIINYRSPASFKKNIDICIISIKNDPNSVRNFNWEYFEKNKELKQRIIDELYKQNYVFDINTPEELKSSLDLCLCSIKNDINSARFFTPKLQFSLTHDIENPDLKINDKIKESIYIIRYYLIEHDFYSLEELAKFDLTMLKDDVVLDYYLKQSGISKNSENEKAKLFYDRIKNFLKSPLSTPVNISDTKKLFHILAQKRWENYKRENNDYYTNIFNRICDSLEKNSNFINALNELKFLIKIDDVLDERKYALFNAFIEYHQIYHNSHADNKIELLQEKRNEISKNTALFISKSKDSFIDEQISLFSEKYKPFFTIRVDNPIVRKKIVEIKQRDMLKKLFTDNDKNLLQKLDNIKNKFVTYNYNVTIGKDKIPHIIDQFISHLITDDKTTIENILVDSKPTKFDEYEIYEKVTKLINRLNNHNIDYNGSEVEKYKSFIKFDGQKYVYNGYKFNEEEIEQIMAYKDLKYVFGKIRTEIIKLAKEIDKFDNLTQDDINSVIEECPFTDEYYQFNFEIYRKYNLDFFMQFVELFENNKDIILNDINYNSLMQLLNTNGLIHICTMTDTGFFNEISNPEFNDMRKYISPKEISSLLSSIPDLMHSFEPNEININNLDKILDLKDMFKYADLEQISLLGKEVTKKIYSNNGFTSSSQVERINVACDLLTAMASRNKSTVPYINGSYHNYKYSMYDATDETLLTTGLDTNACFRCCGNDNDFLHYCALDKNGFVIKLTDLEGNFIGRASGFRHGNGVYINQLRTIYDKKASAYLSERETIIKTFEQACNDIVEISQKNPNEKNKIDFVIVTKSYTLEETKPNVNNNTFTSIGEIPMDVTSDDWKNFKANTKNLRETLKNNYFTTDYGNYPLICVKSAIGELTPEKIKKEDVPAIYLRPRKQINTNEVSDELEIAVNRTNAMYSHQMKTKFEYIKVPQDCKIINGDNWYIILGNQGIINSCYLPSDKLAEKEYNTIMNQLTQDKQIVEETNISKGKK